MRDVPESNSIYIRSASCARVRVCVILALSHTRRPPHVHERGIRTGPSALTCVHVQRGLKVRSHDTVRKFLIKNWRRDMSTIFISENETKVERIARSSLSFDSLC